MFVHADTDFLSNHSANRRRLSKLRIIQTAQVDPKGAAGKSKRGHRETVQPHRRIV